MSHWIIRPDAVPCPRVVRCSLIGLKATPSLVVALDDERDLNDRVRNFGEVRVGQRDRDDWDVGSVGSSVDDHSWLGCANGDSVVVFSHIQYYIRDLGRNKVSQCATNLVNVRYAWGKISISRLLWP